MKTFKYFITAAILGLVTVSCYNMDLEPRNLVGENALFGNENGVAKYFTRLYHEIPLEDFKYQDNGFRTSGNQWEMTKFSISSAAGEASGRTVQYNGHEYWPYGRIREINNFIVNFPGYEANFSPMIYKSLMAEAHFLRAAYYFGMVKRHGGVPLIEDALDPTAPLETLQYPRSTEYESWKFIYDDLKFAMENDTREKGSFVKGRFNRYVAAALMSRAMLHAGSVAKYGGYIDRTGPAVTQGLMTMPADRAAEFFQYAIDAGEFIKAGGYALHTGADKEKAFVEVFTNDTVEDILVKEYGLESAGIAFDSSLMHSWDNMILPVGKGLSPGPGSSLNPVWNLIKMYQIPAIEDAAGKPVRFDKITDFWDNNEMEARCKATFYFSGMTEAASGTIIDNQAGVYKDYPGTVLDGTGETSQSANDYTGNNNGGRRIRAQTAGVTVDEKNKSGDYGNLPNGTKISGLHGLAVGGGDEGYSMTGVIIRKYVSTDPSALRELHQSVQPYKLFRYGEVLLNTAEAMYELGLETGNEELKRGAFERIAEIRDRAGARPYAYKTSPADIGLLPIDEGGKGYNFSIDENLQFIRDERARELAYENIRMFDLLRWRVAHFDFEGGVWLRSFYAYYVANEGKYIFLPEVDKEGRKVNFDNTNKYYKAIPGGARQKNPLLINNAGY